MLSNIIATKPEDLDLAIGLDIGGTKIKCGIVDINGKIMGHLAPPALGHQAPAGIYQSENLLIGFWQSPLC